jgi:ABC-type multidrug transport system fused ATPase/permease subunit
MAVYHKIITGMGGYLVFVLFCALAVAVLYGIFTFRMLSYKWTEDYYVNMNRSDNSIFWKSFGYVFLLTSCTFLKAWLVSLCLTFLMRKIHSKMLFRLLHARIGEYLQRTPVGVIINRFSNDINLMDLNFADILNTLTIFLFGVFLDVYSIYGATTKWYALLPAIFYLGLGLVMRDWYLKAYRECTRLDFVSRSPVIGLATSAIMGGPVIRCLGLQTYFRKKINKKINANTSNALFIQGLRPWFAVKMRLFNLFILLIPSYTMLVMELRQNYDDPSVNLNAISFFISRMIGFSINLINFLYLIGDFELNSISAERCFAFTDIKPEKGYVTLQQDSRIFEQPKKNVRLAEKTVQHKIYQRKEILKSGTVEFNDVTAKYATSTRPVINRVSVHIESGQKVGIVGRTGAGKSSLIKLLWRALTPRKGNIVIDGVDISKFDLKEFRDQITIILQKPNLFEGTIASNISRKAMNREQINKITDELIELGFPRHKLSGGLSYEVETSGSNLSQSEKQIICLMQSLQKQSKIVILDEATAYVDVEMEKKFNEKIWEFFQESTMFIIAHRVANVMGCDRILVFDQGELIQDGSPSELLEDKDGIFFGIWSNR